MTKKKVLKAKLAETKKEVITNKIATFALLTIAMITGIKDIEGGYIFLFNFWSLMFLIGFFVFSGRLYKAIQRKRELQIELNN